MSRVKVLVFVDWFLPGYKAGGPIKSVANIINSLKHLIDFSVVTSNTDFQSTVPYEDIKPNVWQEKDGFKIIYLDNKHQTGKVYFGIIKEEEYAYIYFNSLFSLLFTYLPLLSLRHSGKNIKSILAPRGMLGSGGLQIKKHKKKIFLAIVKTVGLLKGTTWHASTDLEKAEIEKVFGNRVTVKIASNIAASPKTFPKTKKNQLNTAFFFLSRISEKKNLYGALVMLSKIGSTSPVKFTIIGPVEDEIYWAKCKELIALLPENVAVDYCGAVPHIKIPELLQNQHFLLFPTFSENYGHVVVEALAQGCPVILSDQTPWKMLAEEQIGWDIPLADEEKFVKILEECIEMDNETFKKYSKNAQTYFRNRIVSKEIVEQNKKLFDL